LFVNLVGAGERSGALETLLDKIATYKEKAEAIKAKVRKALTYPTVVTIVAFVVTGILLYFVVPQFEGLFSSFGADLPAFTRMVIDLSEFVQSWWWIILGGIGGIVAVIRFFNRTSPEFRRGRDRLLLRIPIIGKILHKAALARFTRTLSTMFAAGVPLVEALDSVGGASGNMVYAQATEQIQRDVSTGAALTTSMTATGVFPTMVLQMASIGEESGSLDHMLAKAAEFYEDEVDEMVKGLSSLMEPFIIVILGVLIGGIVVSMYLPIFKLGAVV